jgi:5-(carboxyamino)imidazole ribonucleotide mutase
LPVIGVPLDAGLQGVDALLSTVMMPPGIPVGSVGVNAAKNAALLAAEILAVNDAELTGKLAAQKEAMRNAVLEKDAKMQKTVKAL